MSKSDLKYIFNYLQKKNSFFFTKYDLIDIINTTLSANPYESKNNDKSLMWKEQAIISFPLLYLASIYIYIHAKQRGCSTFLFATRDCCHWYKIFHKLFPECDVHYFHSSRNMFDKATPQGHHPYDDYVRSIVKNDPSKVMYIDVYGKCKRAFEYFKKKFNQVPHCFLLSCRYRSNSKLPKSVIKYKNKNKFTILVFKSPKGYNIESLNLDSIGTLQDFSEKGPIRDKLEYNIKIIKPYHKCIDFILNKIGPLNIKMKQKKADNLLTQLHINIKNIFQFIANREPTVLKHIKYIKNHPATK